MLLDDGPAVGSLREAEVDEPVEVNGGDDDRRGELLICPDCLRTRRIPVLRIAVEVPELLLAAFDAGGTAPALRQAPGLVMPFEADIRVA